jgi:hypothetical protein
MIFIFFEKVHLRHFSRIFNTNDVITWKRLEIFFKFQLIGVHKIQPKIIEIFVKVSYFPVQNLKFYNYKNIYISTTQRK